MTADRDGKTLPLTRAQRKSAGKSLRSLVSRESHADFPIDAGRDPLPVLTANDAARVPSLLRVRYERMAATPFTFYRGAAALMAHDLANSPRIGLAAQACGDCHLMNFGALTSPEGNVLFDINDFDETYPGVDFIVDLKRLVTSVALAAREAQMPDKKAQALVQATVKAYRDFMSFLAGQSPLDVWNTRMDLGAQIAGFGDAHLETKVLGMLAKAEKRGDDASTENAGITTDAAGRSIFVDKPPFISHVDADGRTVRAILSDKALAAYKRTLLPEQARLLDRYMLRDVAFKAVGIGSVGTYCAIALMETPEGDRIILQLKEALPSSIAGLAALRLDETENGRRVVEGQRAMQAASDAFLGWMRDDSGRQFYLRQLKNRQLDAIGVTLQAKALPAYATLCGRTLARAHARTGDPAMITGYVGGSDVIDLALASFAMSYASQTVLDHARLLASTLVPAGSKAA